MPHRSIFILLLSIIMTTQVIAAPRVVVTIKPLQLISDAILQEVAQAHLLIDSKHSPHQLKLKPSQARQLQQADLVIWVGPNLESKLHKPMLALNTTQNRLTLLETELPQLLNSRHAGLWPATKSHSSHSIDPHIWLNPDNAITIANSIKQQLIAIDPDNQIHYQHNTQQLIKHIQQLDSELQQQLTALQKTPLLVLHDATQYFEHHYQLHTIGAVNIDEQQPIAKRIADIRQAIQQQNVRCLLHTQNVNLKLVKVITENTKLKTVTIDPLGTALTDSQQDFTTLLQNLGQQFLECNKK